MRESSARRELLGEAKAMALQAWLIARARGRKRAPVAGDRVVLFVHGLMAAGPVFDPMREHVRRETGLATLDFTYSSFWTFDRVVKEFAEFVSSHVDPQSRISLVGHSLGGLVARWFIQEQGGIDRVDRLVSLATPHAGSEGMTLRRMPLSAAIQPGSHVIRRLERNAGACSRIPHTTIIAERDGLIRPLESAASIAGARVDRVPGVGHNAMLYDRRVHERVTRALR